MSLPTVLLVGLLLFAPTASAKTLPQFDRAMAAPGDLVGVRVEGASSYQPPLVFYLVRTSVAARIHSRTDARLTRIAVLQRSDSGVIPSRFQFRVPRIAKGDYAISMWFVGTATGTWTNWTPWTLVRKRSGSSQRLVLRIEPR